VKLPEILAHLLENRPFSLAQWVADPLPADLAEQWLPGIQRRPSACLVNGDTTFGPRLVELILHFWSGRDIDGGYKNLLALLPEGRERAMLELSVGQLLMARRLANSWEHLDQGFALAAHLLEPEDYFIVLKRHALLRQLPLGSRPAAGVPLSQLLDEAQVIARLKDGVKRPFSVGSGHSDTVGYSSIASDGDDNEAMGSGYRPASHLEPAGSGGKQCRICDSKCSQGYLSGRAGGAVRERRYEFAGTPPVS
jgi:hypothetical protein